MPAINKPFLKLALALPARWTSSPRRAGLPDLPEATYLRVAMLVSQIRRGQRRGWQLAASRLERELRHQLARAQADLAFYVREVDARSRMTRGATSRDIYEDLLQLAREFGEIPHDLREGWLSVVTEPIELAGIELGSFEIRLQWRAAPSYRVIARDPNPASVREGVTHPHVLDEVLCEGDGHVAIRTALAEGRLFDFFTLVAGVLRTYNRESPFVPLEAWNGQECHDCGYLITNEEQYSCHRCASVLCESCEVSCDGCGDAYCSNCMLQCPACHESLCGDCMQHCSDCGIQFCLNCSNDERCDKCHEANEKDTLGEVELSSTTNNTASSAEPCAPLHALGLGQAPLSA